MIILFKYYVDMKNCENFRGFGFGYIYIYRERERLLSENQFQVQFFEIFFYTVLKTKTKILLPIKSMLHIL